VSGEPIGRRRALGLIGLGTAAVAAGTTGWAAGVGSSTSRVLQPGAVGAELAAHPVLSSSAGLLDITLTAAPGVTLAGRRTAALGYNGTSPGPVLRVRPGDLLRVKLVNRLDQPTNLHTHGLHVSPAGNSDNPFITVDPGASFDYAIQIPADHRPGTYWYHPHHHEHVADQVFGGLSGALIVDGQQSPVSDIERTIMITDTTVDSSGYVAAADPMAKMMGREGEWVLVNGQLQPTIASVPGTSERWRIVNACVSRVLALTLEAHQLTQIAVDGGSLPRARSLNRIVLAPGNRADVIVRPTSQGNYRLIAEPYDRGSAGMMGSMGTSFAGARPRVLATLAVSGPTRPTSGLSLLLSNTPLPAGRAVRTRHLTFATGMGMGGMAFTIDGRRFDPGRVDQAARLGTTEEWVVTNTSSMDHPFHLHVWPFEVVGDSAGTPASGAVQDVVLVPARGWVRLRVHFGDYAGQTVYHCHILDHEDAGMMGHHRRQRLASQ